MMKMMQRRVQGGRRKVLLVGVAMLAVLTILGAHTLRRSELGSESATRRRLPEQFTKLAPGGYKRGQTYTVLKKIIGYNGNIVEKGKKVVVTSVTNRKSGVRSQRMRVYVKEKGNPTKSVCIYIEPPSKCSSAGDPKGEPMEDYLVEVLVAKRPSLKIGDFVKPINASSMPCGTCNREKELRKTCVSCYGSGDSYVGRIKKISNDGVFAEVSLSNSSSRFRRSFAKGGKAIFNPEVASVYAEAFNPPDKTGLKILEIKGDKVTLLVDKSSELEQQFARSQLIPLTTSHYRIRDLQKVAVREEMENKLPFTPVLS